MKPMVTLDRTLLAVTVDDVVRVPTESAPANRLADEGRRGCFGGDDSTGRAT